MAESTLFSSAIVQTLSRSQLFEVRALFAFDAWEEAAIFVPTVSCTWEGGGDADRAGAAFVRGVTGATADVAFVREDDADALPFLVATSTETGWSQKCFLN